jgi:Sulfotransferase family
MEAAKLNRSVGLRAGPAESPIFIVGCPRSGTTLLQCLLATQEGVVTFPETHFFEKVTRDIPENPDGSISPEAALHAFEHGAREMGIEIQHAAESFQSLTLSDSLNKKTLLLELLKANLRASRVQANLSTSRWVEKTPYHVFHIPEILAMFPNAKVICILRHPAAVVLSWKDKVASNSVGPIDKFVYSWINCLRAFETSQENYPNSVHLVKYEDLVADVVATMRKVSAFTDIPLEVKFLAKHHKQAWQCSLPWEKWKDGNTKEAIQNTNREHKAWKNLRVILRVQYLTRRERRRYEYGSWFPLWQSVYNFGVHVTRPVRRLGHSIRRQKEKTVQHATVRDR